MYAVVPEAQAAQILKGFGFCGQKMFVQGFPGTSSTAQAVVDDLHELTSLEAIQQELESVAQSVNRCPQDSSIDVILRAKNFYNGGAGLVAGIRSANGGQWKITMNNVPGVLQQEKQAEEQKQRDADAVQKKAQDLADARALSQKLQSDFRT
jgi:hypothetical protein